MLEVITFYEFKIMAEVGNLIEIRGLLRGAMARHSINGTIILAAEGFNSTVSGKPSDVSEFVASAEAILQTTLRYKSSFHERSPFRKIDVKIKPEIVTLKRKVDVASGIGTHVGPDVWNRIITDPQTLVLDTRNDYEYRSGTFKGAINPRTTKFSELPAFVEEELDPSRHQRIAVFCTGGIRCEKFAPYLLEKGFREVYQLEGGILRYLETVDPSDSLWEGECFVFDERVTVDHQLKKGISKDLSQQEPESGG